MSTPRPAHLRSYALLTLVSKYLTHIHAGKVRDSFELPSHGVDGLGGANLRLVITTDGLSVFDFVLSTLIQNKGMVLNALTVFWHQTLGAKTDLVAWGPSIDAYLPPELQGNRELHERALVVLDLNMVPVEAIARGYLMGSGKEAYDKDQAICGIPLPPGLQEGNRLPTPIFTPTTKALEGHDEHLSMEEVAREHPWMPGLTLQLYSTAHEIAWAQGVIIADTKFEFGTVGHPFLGDYRFGDEKLTPDSSRFLDREEWERAQMEDPQHAPNPWDKQFARDYTLGRLTPFLDDEGRPITGFKKLNPKNPEHVAWVQDQELPAEVVEGVSHRYQVICRRITGRNPEQILGLAP